MLGRLEIGRHLDALLEQVLHPGLIAEGVFVIEAEDFNYSDDGVTGGKTNPQKGTAGKDVNVMPYDGGAYDGLSAVEGVDYERLEVSSPGLDRQLYKPRDYERFAGRLARVTYEDPETGKKRTDVARLQGLRRAEEEPEEKARVLLEDGRTGEVRELPLSNVKLARLEVEL